MTMSDEGIGDPMPRASEAWERTAWAVQGERQRPWMECQGHGM